VGRSVHARQLRWTCGAIGAVGLGLFTLGSTAPRAQSPPSPETLALRSGGPGFVEGHACAPLVSPGPMGETSPKEQMI